MRAKNKPRIIDHLLCSCIFYRSQYCCIIYSQENSVFNFLKLLLLTMSSYCYQSLVVHKFIKNSDCFGESRNNSIITTSLAGIWTKICVKLTASNINKCTKTVIRCGQIWSNRTIRIKRKGKETLGPRRINVLY